MSSELDVDKPKIYQIRIGKQLDALWQSSFPQMRLTLADNGDTLLIGPVLDQAALHGLLRRVRDLGLPLISVLQIQPNPADGADDPL